MGSSEKDVMGNIDYSAQDILYMLRDLPDACCIFKVITDPFGTVQDMLFLFVNEKYASLVGKPTSELIGSTYYSTVANRDEDWIRLSYQAAFMRQSVINRTYNTQFSRWFEFWAVPVYQKGFCAFIIHDVTAEKRKEENQVIKSKSNNFILDCAKQLSKNDFKKGVKYTLKELGAVLKADRVCIIESNHGEVGDIHEWSDRFSGTGLPSKKAFEEYDFFTMWERQLGENDVVVINDSKVVNERNSQVYKSVLEGSVSRYIIAALRNKSESIGYLLIDNFSLDLDINLNEVIESVSIFLSEELLNYKLMQEMSYMTTHDPLTELGNRHAFNATMHMLEGMDISVGICFIDINGLKFFNDNKGHDEGDNVIKEVGGVISSVFKKKYCYRIGGDEFLVIVPQVTQEHFEGEVEKLRKKSKAYPIAIGAVWSDEAKDVKELINQADKLMYADKAGYYSEHDRRKEEQD
ncbi:diguanylate cyclase (GGDEF) domain-containing protein [Pseudobutyrivibrio sp. YE44]|uniref:sensor domain-containing diguanylate cyclase n=1 Tax=Pseudobutyrivibrio sp. YE44 TaxID=1520802 RepID=UPI00088B1412|nr:sensor domain-containing diguanylate cyclase [Pseudobutyrivibrio sp. YE44]SDB45467.1 diguanylate cyclase (GGDEF) domain-containing protein [Pseudobutyrivibrio sp. YE44]